MIKNHVRISRTLVTPGLDDLSADRTEILSRHLLACLGSCSPSLFTLVVEKWQKDGLSLDGQHGLHLGCPDRRM